MGTEIPKNTFLRQQKALNEKDIDRADQNKLMTKISTNQNLRKKLIDSAEPQSETVQQQMEASIVEKIKVAERKIEQADETV